MAASVTGPKMAQLLEALKSLGFSVPEPEQARSLKPQKPRIVGGRSVAELGRSRAHCPHCGFHGQVLKSFGIRDMGNGIVRVQSWCRECRRDPKNDRAMAFAKAQRKGRKS